VRGHALSVLSLGVLGRLEVVRDGKHVRLVGKPAALLVSLLLRRNDVVATDRLLDELWDERPPKSARKVLQAYVSQLRKALGAERVQTFPTGYLLAVSEDEVDLARFERLLREAQRARDADDGERALALLDDALELWRGVPLADLREEPFAQTAAERLDDLHLHALETRFDLLLARGAHHDLVPELDALVDRHPLREHLREQLMLALYRSGRQADALARYRDGRETLVRTLGLEPAPSLRRLEEAILQQHPALETGESSRRAAAFLVAGGLELVEPVARLRGRELVLVGAVRELDDLQPEIDALGEERDRLAASGVQARVAAFRTDTPARDLARLAEQAHVELAVVAVELGQLRDLESLAPLLQRPACDVALIADDGARAGDGPVVVAFGGGENDWAALELGLALAQAHERQLVLAGGSRNGTDASRALAAASLAVQRLARIDARPLVLPAGSAALRSAAEDATALLLGTPDEWREHGLGAARLELVAQPVAPTALVRRGVRVATLSPEGSFTRFTWSQ
jgi:DNA-binding SARP family transcriptional activator